MKRLLWMTAALAVVLSVVPCPAPACSLCGSMQSRQTLRQEMEQSKIVLYGVLANARLTDGAGARPGSGTTDLHILRVLKSDPLLGERKVVQLQQYLPILDPKDPPRFVVFCTVINGQLQAVHGRAVKSDALLGYVEGAKALTGKSRTEALLYFFRFLSHEDEAVAADAFLEFARSSDKEVGEVARHLPADQVRRLLLDPKTPVERLGLYAFLLGAAGNAQDAETLRALIEQPNDRTVGALDGLLSGYIHLKPREGWDLAAAILADGKRSFTQRYAVTRTVRFYHGWRPAETKAQVLHCLDVMLVDGEVADLAIDDLRRWQMWDLTAKVLACFDRASHAAPIVRRGIVRYALCCPQPEAQRFVDDLRRRDLDLLNDVAEGLALEKK